MAAGRLSRHHDGGSGVAELVRNDGDGDPDVATHRRQAVILSAAVALSV